MADVRTPHPEYVVARDKWARCRDLIEGSDRVKAASPYTGPAAIVDPSMTSRSVVAPYLPTPPGMTAVDFEFYKARAQFYNATSRTVGALSGFVMQRAPIVDGARAIGPHLSDLTLLNEPVEAVADRIVTEVVSVGRHGLLLDMPLYETAPGARPYWCLLEAERVINWKTAPVGPDPDQLVLVVFRDDVADPAGDAFGHAKIEQYRELALEGSVFQARIWRKGPSAEFIPGDWVIPTRRGVPLDFIPFVFVGTRDISPTVSKPPLLDLTDVNIGHFRNSADHEQGLYMTALPIPWASGLSSTSAPLRVGGSAAWMLPPGGQAGMLEFSGAGLAAIRLAMAAKERLMATLGARLLEDPSATSAETATAVRIKHSGEGAALRSVASAVSLAMSIMLRWHVWWFTGTGEIDPRIKVSLSQEFFGGPMSSQEVQALLSAVQAEKMSFKTFYFLLQRGNVARPGVSAEQELAEIEHEAPPPVEAEAVVDEGDPEADPASMPGYEEGDELVTAGNPWHVVKRGGKWLVVKTATGEKVGEHATEAKARAQLAALYMNAD